jgi:hypothetical protein
MRQTNEKTRRASRVAVLAAAVTLAGGALHPVYAGTIDIRVTPEMRVRKSTPAPATVNPQARWSGNRVSSPSAPAPMRVVQYPNVVIGTHNYLPADNTPVTGNVVVTSNGRNGVVITNRNQAVDLLPANFGGGALTGGGVTGVGFPAATIGDAGVVVTGNGTLSGRVDSPFVGVAGPGFGLGVAGPALLPGAAGAQFNGVSSPVTRPVSTRTPNTGNVTSGVTTGGEATGRLTMSTSSLGGAAGNATVGRTISVGRGIRR